MSKVEVHLDGPTHLAIGLMSGTSHDGVSAALVRIDVRKIPPTQLVAFRTYPYTADFAHVCSRPLRPGRTQHPGR
jgi:1,6-anhydro-N-acetylmuramate kinase